MESLIEELSCSGTDALSYHFRSYFAIKLETVNLNFQWKIFLKRVILHHTKANMNHSPIDGEHQTEANTTNLFSNLFFLCSMFINIRFEITVGINLIRKHFFIGNETMQDGVNCHIINIHEHIRNPI